MRVKTVDRRLSMKKPSIVAAVLVFGVALSLSNRIVFAHHSAASEYDLKNKVTMTGTILKMEWINPHSWLYINVTEPDGSMATWALEFGNPTFMLHHGWRKDDLPVGAVVTVEGARARNGSRAAVAESVVLAATGKKLFTGGLGSSIPKDQ
jgi:uncharacterized protein DUF6152